MQDLKIYHNNNGSISILDGINTIRTFTNKEMAFLYTHAGDYDNIISEKSSSVNEIAKLQPRVDDLEMQVDMYRRENSKLKLELTNIK